MSDVRSSIRNVAIVAHVDHGKTTLVDALLQESLKMKIAKDDRIMDGNDQEKERGITILAKNAAVTHAGVKINIVDKQGRNARRCVASGPAAGGWCIGSWAMLRVLSGP